MDLLFVVNFVAGFLVGGIAAVVFQALMRHMSALFGANYKKSWAYYTFYVLAFTVVLSAGQRLFVEQIPSEIVFINLVMGVVLALIDSITAPSRKSKDKRVMSRAAAEDLDFSHFVALQAFDSRRETAKDPIKDPMAQVVEQLIAKDKRG